MPSNSHNPSHRSSELTPSLRLCWRHKLRPTRNHHPRAQRPPPCAPGRRLHLHHALGRAPLGLPPLPHHQDGQGRPLRRQARQVLPLPRLLDLPDDLGLDRLAARDRAQLAQRDAVPAALLRHRQGRRRHHLLRRRLHHGGRERRAKVRLPEGPPGARGHLRQGLLQRVAASELLWRDHYPVR